MKMVEIKYRGIMNELNKLNARLERAEKSLAKKQALAEKMGVAEWTNDQHREWLSTVETTDMGWIVNKDDQKKNGAWFDLHSIKRDVEDIKGEIARAESRFEKAEEKLAEYRKEVERIERIVE